MARIVVIGGGLIGLATAVMVAKQGHDVTVLERDPDPLPNAPRDAWDSWKRQGVMQFRQPHFLLPQGKRILDAELPEVIRALQDADAIPCNPLSALPPTLADRAPRPGDGKFLTCNARRPVLEHALATVADKWVETRRGARAIGVATSGSRRHVTGVWLHDGRELRADLVIDAMGATSPLPIWLSTAGAGEMSERAEHSGFTSYSRFFRARPGAEPSPPALTGTLPPFGCYSIATVPSDANTWSVTVSVHSRDRALKALRDEASWTRLVTASPHHARLIDGEPVTGVLAASGVVNRIRSLVSRGVPAATGILLAGDSWACTSPSLGRGVTFGLTHAVIIAEVVAEHLKQPLALSLAYDRLTRERLLPWYRNSAALDAQRLERIAAVVDGRPPQPPAEPPDYATAVMRDVLTAAARDADVFRAYLEMVMMLAPPQEIFSRLGLAEKIAEAAAGHRPWTPPGPSRAEVLQMLS
jgi:2-polyprenyl-6-methoxyphenol hydroxylase-like FAD-dependent oxidoreductase